MYSMNFIVGQLVYSVSVDCANVIALAIGLHLNTKQTFIMNQINSDCCSASGVTCVSQRVTRISWSSMGLDGTIIGASIPPLLQYLWIQRNAITGSIPDSLPSSLTWIALDGNLMTGDIPTLPTGM